MPVMRVCSFMRINTGLDIFSFFGKAVSLLKLPLGDPSFDSSSLQFIYLTYEFQCQMEQISSFKLKSQNV